MRLLLVEDDPIVAAGVRDGLIQAGFGVDHVASGEQAESALQLAAFDLAIVDLGLPKMDGLELIRRVRRQGIALPVLILTARDTLEDRVDGLELGADDYLVKPFQLPELVARIRALIRRSKSVVSSRIDYGPLVLDLGTRQAQLGGGPLELTGREWGILEQLILNAPRVVSKNKLVESISAWDNELTPNAVETYVSRLRHKLDPGGVFIRTVRGIGYRLDEPQPPTGP